MIDGTYKIKNVLIILKIAHGLNNNKKKNRKKMCKSTEI